jgi:hypothetical protein
MYINLISSFLQTSDQKYIILLKDVHLSAVKFSLTLNYRKINFIFIYEKTCY